MAAVIINEMKTQATGTFTPNLSKYDDWLTEELMTWVRNVPLDSDALNNIPRIIAYYENRKTFWQKLKALIV